MSKKNQKKHQNVSMAQIIGQLQPKVVQDPGVGDETPKIDAAIKESVNLELDNEHFRWCFIENEMRWNNTFSFKDYKRDLRKFLQEIEKPIYDKFYDKTWAQVNHTDHCGKYRDNLSRNQKEIACSPHKPDDEQLYHIHISPQHVLFGYRIDNVFHITINDPEHGFDNL